MFDFYDGAPDYEGAILARQDWQEIDEDNNGCDVRDQPTQPISQGENKMKLIFSNYCDEGCSFADAKQSLLDRHDGEDGYVPSDQEVWDEVAFLTSLWWEDMQIELQSELFPDWEPGQVYVLFGHGGLWDGNHAGGGLIHDFSDLSRVWDNMDAIRIYDDDGDLVFHAMHHDGTNVWRLRRVTEEGKEYLKENYLPERILVSDCVLRYAEKIWFLGKPAIMVEGA